ncbi:hypothetical protein C3F34_07580 [Acinetobacter sp. ACNIH2]|jgi:hypothetical protein|nr:hypothetical protein C3F34_07580 [Acinetobacter sp. ACNIH2]
MQYLNPSLNVDIFKLQIMFLKEKKAQPWGKLGDKLKTFCGESGRYHTISMKHDLITQLLCLSFVQK